MPIRNPEPPQKAVILCQPRSEPLSDFSIFSPAEAAAHKSQGARVTSGLRARPRQPPSPRLSFKRAFPTLEAALVVMGVAGWQQKEQNAFLTNQTLEFGFKRPEERLRTSVSILSQWEYALKLRNNSLLLANYSFGTRSFEPKRGLFLFFVKYCKRLGVYYTRNQQGAVITHRNM